MSSFLDLIFPRPYDQPGYYYPISLKPIQHCSSGELTDCLSVFRYRGVIRQTLIDIKYNFVSDSCSSLTSFVVTKLTSSYPNLISYWQKKHFSLVPIPLHSSRLNWRGFNQAEILGRLTAKKLGVSFSPILIRTQNTSPQVSLKDKLLRSRNLVNVFSITSNPPPHILLFDDVATTYSTLRSAAKKLVQSGVKTVTGLTIAG